jgi:hypothetical protein
MGTLTSAQPQQMLVLLQACSKHFQGRWCSLSYPLGLLLALFASLPVVTGFTVLAACVTRVTRPSCAARAGEHYNQHSNSHDAVHGPAGYSQQGNYHTAHHSPYTNAYNTADAQQAAAYIAAAAAAAAKHEGCCMGWWWWAPITVTVTVFGTAKPCNPQGSQRLMGYQEQNLHSPERDEEVTTPPATQPAAVAATAGLSTAGQARPS